MDHEQLLAKIDERVDGLKDDIHRLEREVKKLQTQDSRVAVLESKMAGVVSIGTVIFTAVVGLITKMFLKG